MSATICAYMNPVNGLDLWTNHKEPLIEDYIYQGFNTQEAENMALHSINAILIENGSKCSAFGLPEPNEEPEIDHPEKNDGPDIATLTEEQGPIAIRGN